MTQDFKNKTVNFQDENEHFCFCLFSDGSRGNGRSGIMSQLSVIIVKINMELLTGSAYGKRD